ncbi:hypothetical protein B0O99DRAFT_708021 [Bisporella sp. PMI_857]|nr:hypothetical protein B0O99DRAFT_708021 [Bisporella sp. PMI_857]
MVSLFFPYHPASSCLGTDYKPAIYNLTVRHSQESQNLYAFSQYAGPPAPNIDKAWHELLSPIDIRVTKEELERNNRTSVELPEGGYLAWLGVFHEVHCVKLLRQWKYKENYYPNITEKQRFDLESHTDHCLDRILASLICHPDTASLVTFYWDKTYAPTVDGTKTLHSCIDWDAMIESTRSRMVSNAEVAALRNPLLEDLP